MECRLTKLNSLKEQINKLQEEAKVAAKELFQEGANQVFKDDPTVVKFSWTQYTPYFNDGEACVFGSNHNYASVYTATTQEDEDGDCMENSGDFPAVEKFLKQFDDDDMYSMFGDHVTVTVTPTGIEVDEYDHD